MNTEKIRNRIVYFDYLRILAALAVILVHVSGQNMSALETASYPWTVFTVFNYAGGWSVTMFVMISGALFLDNDRPLDLKKLYKGNILRIVTALFFWSSIYAVENYIKYRDIKTAATMLLEGRYHMWYLFMTIGLYISAPVVRKITKSKSATEYFLAAGFVFIFLIPETVAFLKWLSLPYTDFLLNTVSSWLTMISYPMGPAYLYYFVLGYYLTNCDVSRFWVKCSYFAGIFGYAFTVLMETGNAYLTGESTTGLSHSLNTLAMTVGIFLFAKYVLGNVKLGDRPMRVLKNLSRYTFGAYLVHALVLSQFRDRLHLTTLSFEPIVSVLVLEVCVAVVSFGISMVLNRVPVLKKYIV